MKEETKEINLGLLLLHLYEVVLDKKKQNNLKKKQKKKTKSREAKMEKTF
jgi:hypothetical protein